MVRLDFWSQALDNRSDDIIGVGSQIFPTSSVEAKSVLSRLASLTRNGKRLFEENGISIRADWPDVLIVVPCNERDSDNRIANIFCITQAKNQQDLFTTDNALEVETQVLNFAKQIERTIPIHTLDLLTQAFIVLKKKIKIRLALSMMILVLISILVLNWVYGLMVFWGSSEI